MHTLEGIPKNWYTDQELHRGTMSWLILQKNFTVNFSFEHENPKIDATLKQIRGVILIQEPEVELITEKQKWNKQIMKELLSCYHVQEEVTYKHDSRNIQIEEA
jgi:hypothetical protein